MLHHTLLAAFEAPVQDDDLDRFIADIESAVRGTGLLRSFAWRRHIPVAGETEVPALVATAILRFGVDDHDALAGLFATPEAGEVFERWRARYPYRVAWANHEPLD